MIRTCDGSDATLSREKTFTTTPGGQETRVWVPCDCGTTFDDVERMVIYPHYYLKVGKERLQELIASGMTTEQIREQLTRQPGANYDGDITPTPEKGEHVSNEDFEATGQFGASEANESVEADESADADITSEATEANDSAQDVTETTSVNDASEGGSSTRSVY